jgi:DNA-binding transcriptional regulator YdaS (Cro superfamily)
MAKRESTPKIEALLKAIKDAERIADDNRKKLREELFRDRLKRLEPGIGAAIAAAGGMRQLAEKLGITSQAILQWKLVPVERLIEIERVTGVDRAVLRPDLFERHKPKQTRQHVAA